MAERPSGQQGKSVSQNSRRGDGRARGQSGPAAPGGGLGRVPPRHPPTNRRVGLDIRALSLLL